MHVNAQAVQYVEYASTSALPDEAGQQTAGLADQQSAVEVNSGYSGRHSRSTTDGHLGCTIQGASGCRIRHCLLQHNQQTDKLDGHWQNRLL